MEGGHHLAVGIKSQLLCAGKFLFQFLPAHTEPGRQVQQGQFGGIPDAFSPVQHPIVAQSHSF